MLRPRARKTYRMARLVMRTQAVPTAARAQGSTSSVMPISTGGAHASVGFFLEEKRLRMGGKGAGVIGAHRKDACNHRAGEVPAWICAAAAGTQASSPGVS